MRERLALRHASPRTGEVYTDWVRRYVRYHGGRHPRNLGEAELTAFLTHLAVERRVAASTQNQALAALLFLYQHVLELRVGWLDGVVRAKRPGVVRWRCPCRAVAVTTSRSVNVPSSGWWSGVFLNGDT